MFPFCLFWIHLCQKSNCLPIQRGVNRLPPSQTLDPPPVTLSFTCPNECETSLNTGNSVTRDIRVDSTQPLVALLQPDATAVQSVSVLRFQTEGCVSRRRCTQRKGVFVQGSTHAHTLPFQGRAVRISAAHATFSSLQRLILDRDFTHTRAMSFLLHQSSRQNLMLRLVFDRSVVESAVHSHVA